MKKEEQIAALCDEVMRLREERDMLIDKLRTIGARARTCGECRHYEAISATDHRGYCDAPMPMHPEGSTVGRWHDKDASECQLWRGRGER